MVVVPPLYTKRYLGKGFLKAFLDIREEAELSRMISEKLDVPYCQMVSFVRRRIRFDILCVSAISLGEKDGMREFEEVTKENVELVNLTQK